MLRMKKILNKLSFLRTHTLPLSFYLIKNISFLKPLINIILLLSMCKHNNKIEYAIKHVNTVCMTKIP
jgi:hypothetical protein